MWLFVWTFLKFPILCAYSKGPGETAVYTGSGETQALLGLCSSRVITTFSSWVGSYEPRHEKTCLHEFGPGKTETVCPVTEASSESWKFEFSKYRYYTIQEANSIGTDQTM